MNIDMKRGRPRPDFSAGRAHCPTHGDVALSYIGNEEYACWHCAKAAYDQAQAATAPDGGVREGQPGA